MPNNMVYYQQIIPTNMTYSIQLGTLLWLRMGMIIYLLVVNHIVRHDIPDYNKTI